MRPIEQRTARRRTEGQTGHERASCRPLGPSGIGRTIRMHGEGSLDRQERQDRGEGTGCPQGSDAAHGPRDVWKAAHLRDQSMCVPQYRKERRAAGADRLPAPPTPS